LAEGVEGVNGDLGSGGMVWASLRWFDTIKNVPVGVVKNVPVGVVKNVPVGVVKNVPVGVVKNVPVGVAGHRGRGGRAPSARKRLPTYRSTNMS
jgi:hypothetical protein